MSLDIRFMPVSVVSHVVAEHTPLPGMAGTSHTAATFDFPTAVSVERHSL